MRGEARKKMAKMLKGMMKDDMYGDMKDKMKGMQKVTVASDSKEGLEEGLDKAKQIMEKRKEMEGDDYACGGTKKGKKYAEGGYKRGYEEGDEVTKKKPKYLSHRRENKEKMHDQYKDGGIEMSKKDKIKELMKKKKK